MGERFSVAKKGYDMEEVDQYISTIENVLKSYKEKDTAIKNAIINAQIAADNIIKTAEDEAKAIKKQTNRDLERIFGSIEQQKIFIKDFQQDYNTMVSKYIHEFNESEILKIFSKINDLEENITKTQMGFNKKEQKIESQMVQKEVIRPDEEEALLKMHEERLRQLKEEEAGNMQPKMIQDFFKEQPSKIYRESTNNDTTVSQETKKYSKLDVQNEGIGELYFKKEQK
jgi:hypothetical protein